MKNSNKNKWSDLYLSFFNGVFAETWFKWTGWLLITAALYALGKSGNSQTIIYFSCFSGLLTLLYALNKLEEGIDNYIPGFQKYSILVKIILIPVLFIIVVSSALVISNAINAVFV